MVNNDLRIDSCILRDMNEGVLVLDTGGTVIYLNSKGRNFLGLDYDLTGCKYAQTLLDNDVQNDSFHQIVLDAVYDKEKSHKATVPWHKSGTTRTFEISSSFLRDENSNERIGVVVLFSDVTERETLNIQRRESSVIIATIMLCVCTYLFFCAAVQSYQWNIPKWATTWIVQFMGLVSFFVVFKKTSFSFKDIGLRPINVKATIIPDIFITAFAVVLLVVVKLLLLRVAPDFFPAGAPFWDWSSVDVSDLYYPVTVIFQELFIQGVMLGCLQRIFIGKYATGLSILICSVIFGVIHIAYGFQYMVAAALMIAALGLLYKRQGHIWGLCIFHYVLGEVAVFLRYIV